MVRWNDWPLTLAAIGDEAVEDPITPQEGDQLVVHWPNGPNFHMTFLRLDSRQGAPIHEGWLFLLGIVGHTVANKWFDSNPIYQTLYAHPVTCECLRRTGEPGHWEMLPKLLNRAP